MADIYIDAASGNDANPGSESAKFATIRHATAVAAAGDVLHVTPGIYRQPVSISSDIAIVATANKFSLLGTIDVSQGAVVGNLLKNGSIDSWVSGIPGSWSITSTAAGSSAITKNTSVISGGIGASAKFFREISGSLYLIQFLYLEARTQYQFEFKHYDTTASLRFKWNIYRDEATNFYLQADGSWTSTAYTFDDVGASVGSWATYTKTFTTDTSGIYSVTIFFGYSSTSYLDDVSITPVANMHSWSAYGDRTLRLAQTLQREVKTLLACSVSNFDVDHTMLQRQEMGSDKDFLQPGQWVWATGVLYYRPLDGVDIADLHIEASQPWGGGNVETSLSISSPCEVSNFNVLGSSVNGIRVTSTCTEQAYISNFYVHGCGKEDIGNNILPEGVVLLEDFESSYSGVKGVLANGVGANVICRRGIASYGWSGGMYAMAGATLRCEYCVAKYNGREQHDDDSGFNAHSGYEDNVELYHCTSFGNYGRGISISGSGDCVVKNCISHGNGVDAHLASDFSGSLVHKTNVFGTLYYTWELGDREIVRDAGIDTNGRISSSNSVANHGADIITGVNDGAQTDPWDNAMLDYPNIGADQYDYAPGYGPWSTCDSTLPTDGQVFKSHTAPIAAKKLTVFPGVATTAQINEAAE